MIYKCYLTKNIRKFFQAINLREKVENYKKILKVYIKIDKKIIISLPQKADINKKYFKTIHENGWKVIKFDDAEIEKYKFHQH